MNGTEFIKLRDGVIQGCLSIDEAATRLKITAIAFLYYWALSLVGEL